MCGLWDLSAIVLRNIHVKSLKILEFTEREKKNYVGSVINNYIASQKQIGIPVASMCFPSSQSSMYISGAQADEFCTGLQVN